MATGEVQTAQEFMAADTALDDLLTVQETARVLKVSVSWIYEHVRPDAEDRLPVVKLGKYLLKQVNEPYRTMVSLIAATGLRIGELLALRWSALDLEGGALTVRESVFEGKFQPPKTRKALRTIPLGRHAVAALSAHRERVSRREDADLVFGNGEHQKVFRTQLTNGRPFGPCGIDSAATAGALGGAAAR